MTPLIHTHDDGTYGVSMGGGPVIAGLTRAQVRAICMAVMSGRDFCLTVDRVLRGLKA